VFFGVRSGLVGLCGILAAALAAATIYCTGMIYASLRPIHQWHNPWVVPNYFALRPDECLAVLDFLVRLWEPRAPGVAVAAAIFVIVAWWLKEAYWRSIDTNSAPSTVASATCSAVGASAHARAARTPRKNFLLKEMGFCDQRASTATRLRSIVRLAVFALPALLTLLALLVGGVIGGGRGGSRRRRRGRRGHSRALAVFCRSQAHRDALLWRRGSLRPPDVAW